MGANGEMCHSASVSRARDPPGIGHERIWNTRRAFHIRPDQEHDGFQYIVLAKSLLAGEGYPTRHWMPGFPLLLSQGIAAFGLDFLLLKLAMVALSIVAVGFTFLLFKRLVGTAIAFPLALLLAATPIYFDYSHRLMSEVPYLAFCMAALVAMLAIRDRSAASRPSLAWAMLLVLSGSIAVLMRGNGLALVPAIAACIVWRRDEPARLWIYGLASFAIVGTFLAWSALSSEVTYEGIDNVTYLQEVQARDVDALWAAGGYADGVEKASASELFRRLFENVAWRQTYQVASLVAPGAEALARLEVPYHLGFLLAAALALPTLVGCIVLARRSPPAACYLIVSMALVVVYPTGGDSRMLLPSIPLLLVAAYLGLERIFGTRFAKGWTLAALWLSTLLCLGDARDRARHPYSDDGFSDFLEIVTDALPRAGPSSERVVPPPGMGIVVRALAENPTIGFQEASSRVASGEMPTAIVIQRASEREELAARLPAGTALEPLSSHGAYRLVRLRPADLPWEPEAPDPATPHEELPGRGPLEPRTDPAHRAGSRGLDRVSPRA